MEEKGGFLNSIIGKIKHAFSSLDIQGLIDKIKSSTAGSMALYFGASFAVGFLFKKYFKFMLGCTIVTVAILMVLQHNNVINFDWDAFYKLIQYNPADVKFNTLLESSISWVKSNLIIFISAACGFIIGYKLA